MSKQLYLVGIDGSECSNKAVKEAINIAEKTSAKVHLVYVMHWPPVTPITAGGVEPFVFNREDEEQRVEKQVIEPLMHLYAESKVELSRQILFGDPVDTLHEEVVNQQVDMVFVGRKGRSTIVDLILGSVANKLAHLIEVPIVLVP